MSNLTLKEALRFVKTEQDLIRVLQTVNVDVQNTLDNTKTLLYSGVGQLPEEKYQIMFIRYNKLKKVA